MGVKVIFCPQSIGVVLFIELFIDVVGLKGEKLLEGFDLGGGGFIG